MPRMEKRIAKNAAKPDSTSPKIQVVSANAEQLYLLHFVSRRERLDCVISVGVSPSDLSINCRARPHSFS